MSHVECSSFRRRYKWSIDGLIYSKSYWFPKSFPEPQLLKQPFINRTTSNATFQFLFCTTECTPHGTLSHVTILSSNYYVVASLETYMNQLCSKLEFNGNIMMDRAEELQIYANPNKFCENILIKKKTKFLTRFHVKHHTQCHYTNEISEELIII